MELTASVNGACEWPEKSAFSSFNWRVLSASFLRMWSCSRLTPRCTGSTFLGGLSLEVSEHSYCCFPCWVYGWCLVDRSGIGTMVLGVSGNMNRCTSVLRYHGTELGDDIKFDVPALYVFGDSTVDCGNNNFLPSPSKANNPPFGVDFTDGKPTGRFSNGRIEANFNAQVAGLPFPPPCLGLSKEEHKTLRTGVNYGSSSCGVLPDTGKFLGTCRTFDKQTSLFETTMKNWQPLFDSPKTMADYLSKSLFFICMGNADISTGYDLLDNTTK
ncbi:hypothetical protein Dsin_020871 [Dipteronia sinensis]|uniref:GDSL esterase/lipase n=1 Tax=Dipteronia sinensis TaxID=43782 RepID=A0AAE0AAA2_9ROSI|nr:hypothetical protein Dsin_020871 [Dipteronia sinensis]